MRFLHLADLHIGKRVNGFSMLEDQIYIFNQILDIIQENQTDAVLIAGDIYDKALPSAQAVQVLDRFLSKLVALKQQVFMIAGNHDSEERLAFGGDVMKKAGVYVSPVFSAVPEPIVLQDQWGEIGIYLLPFLRSSSVQSMLGNGSLSQQWKLSSERRNILIAHQFLTGAKQDDSEEFMVGGVENMDYQLFTDFDYVALGHIHRAQKVGREYIRYAGTPLKYSFSEAEHRKTVTLLDMGEKGELSIHEIPLKPLREMRMIRGTYNELVSRDYYIGTNTEDYIHATLTDEEEILDVMNKLRYVYPNIMKLEYDNIRTKERQLIVPIEKMEKQNPMDLFDAFYEQQNNQRMSKEQREFAENILKQIQKGEE